MARRPPGRPRPRPGRHRACPPPYDLRHAALSLWLNATGTPAEVAARAGTSTRVLHEVYLHCTDGQDNAVSQRIEDALDAGTGITHSSPQTKASGYPHRRHHPEPGPLYVHELVPGPAYSPRPPGSNVTHMDSHDEAIAGELERRFNSSWQGWHLDKDNLTLWHETLSDSRGYTIDLLRCTTSAALLGWIMEISAGVGRPIVGLVRAFDDIFQPRINLCLDGETRSRRLSRRKIRELVAAAQEPRPV